MEHTPATVDKPRWSASTGTSTASSGVSVDDDSLCPGTGDDGRPTAALDDEDESPLRATHTPGAQFPTRHKMRNAVLSAATNSRQVLRREALKAASDPRKQSRCVRHLESTKTVSLYQYHKSRGATRVMGVAQIQSPIHEVVSTVSHKSPLSLPLLNPGLADFETLYALVDEPTRFVAIRSVVMDEQWKAPHLGRTREFVVIESHEAFTTEDGRRGWAVSYHSLAWPGCRDPPLSVVRGSMYNTGLVVLERERKSETIDLYAVTEFRLKGHATASLDGLAAKNRVLHSLLLLTGTIEQRAMGELEVLQTSDFREIDRNTMLAECSICAETDSALDRSIEPTYRCRRCCVSVCGGCSATWRRGSKAMRLCKDCWGETTLQF